VFFVSLPSPRRAASLVLITRASSRGAVPFPLDMLLSPLPQNCFDLRNSAPTVCHPFLVTCTRRQCSATRQCPCQSPLQGKRSPLPQRPTIRFSDPVGTTGPPPPGFISLASPPDSALFSSRPYGFASEPLPVPGPPPRSESYAFSLCGHCL